MVGEKIRWFEQCAHGIELHEYCPICADLTTEARQMFEPVEDKKEGTYAPDPR